MAVLEVEGLRVLGDGVLAVDDVSFQLAAESDTALVGPNGAGKCSLVGAILGLIPRQAGEVRILGHRLGPAGQLPPQVRAQPAFLPQALPLQGRLPLTVAEFVGFGLDPPGPRLPWSGGGARRSAVGAALAKTACGPLADRLLFNLRRREGWTVLQVSHDLDMVLRSCDQVLCLNRQLRCSGRPELARSRAQLERLYDPADAPSHPRRPAPQGSHRSG